MNRKSLSIFWYLLNFFHQCLYSFQCTDISSPWVNLDETTVHALTSGQLLLVGLHSWLGLLAGLHIQVGLLGGLPSLAEILAVLCCQVGPPAGLCNHLWLGSITSCVSWQGGATGLALCSGGATDRVLSWRRASGCVV